MWFRSDGSFAHHGFHLNWTTGTAQCGGLVTGRTYGAIESPGYPGRYPHNRDCTWTIRTDMGKRIQFQFATLQIESHPNCSYDFVEVSSLSSG
jgi:cubilin